MADGRVDDAKLVEACRAAARTMHAFDMAAMAEAMGSVISAVLFGALAGSGALPFQRMAFEAAIRRGQVGVNSSLAAFGAGFEAAQAGEASVSASPAIDRGKDHAPHAVRDLLRDAERNYFGEARLIVVAGVERLIDYQDVDYAREFLARLERFRDIERQHGDGSGGGLLAETARQLALGMAYEDTIRVADLKIRSSRFARVREEAKIEDGQILEIAEFFHPRTQEIADTLPVGLGRWLMRTGWARGLLDRLTRKGKVVKTTSITGFLLLYLLSRLRPLRRRSLRFAVEQAALAAWLDLVVETARSDYSLALQVARMRSLVKGYGDTHERGSAKFGQLVALLPRLRAHGNPGVLLEGLIKAALADEGGQALDKAVADLIPAPSSSSAPSAVSRVS
jgi:indolepyruvate ferredoxin oxidoreductase beta subunit